MFWTRSLCSVQWPLMLDHLPAPRTAGGSSSCSRTVGGPSSSSQNYRWIVSLLQNCRWRARELFCPSYHINMITLASSVLLTAKQWTKVYEFISPQGHPFYYSLHGSQFDQTLTTVENSPSPLSSLLNVQSSFFNGHIQLTTESRPTTEHAHTHTHKILKSTGLVQKGLWGFSIILWMENPHQLSGQPIISRTATGKFESALK